MRLLNWLKSLFTPEHAKTSLAGVATLAGVAATGYMMSTGAVPVTPESVTNMAAATTAGVGLLLAKDGVAPSKVQAVQADIAQVQAAIPTVAGLVEQVKAVQAQHDNAAATVAQLAPILATIAATVPPPQTPPAE